MLEVTVGFVERYQHIIMHQHRGRIENQLEYLQYDIRVLVRQRPEDVECVLMSALGTWLLRLCITDANDVSPVTA